MKNIITITWFVLLMSGCQKNESNSVQKDNSSRHQLIKELAAGKDRFKYNNVEQGHYEDVFYFNDEVNLVVLDFEILKVYDEGKWLPLNSIKLVDQTGKKTLYVKYLATVEQKYFNIHIMIDGESYFDEEFDLDTPISQFEVEWYDHEVQIKADGFEYALSIPFDVNRFGIGISSMEVINRLTVF